MKPISKRQALAVALVAGTVATTGAWGQTTTTIVVNPAPSDPGAFDRLSPGNQRIADALYQSQTQPLPGSSGPIPMTRDQIATAKGETGWGQVFHRMQSDGLTQAKNMGQVVSGHYMPPTTPAGTTAVATTSTSSKALGVGGKKDGTIVTASGHTISTGSSTSKGGAAKGGVSAKGGGGSGTITTASGSTAGAPGNSGVAPGHSGGGGKGGANGHAK